MGDKSLAARLKAVLAENDTCADCPAKSPLWASYLRWPKKGTVMSDESRMDESVRQHGDDEIDVDIDGALGVIVCNECAPHHHFELGKKRCLIKYLKYSHELTARDLDILEQSGNALVNQYYEANLWGSFQKELVLGDKEAEASRRGKFIKEKYKKCLYRDHVGIAKAVEQCLELQTYQNDMGATTATKSSSGGGGGSSRRSSTATTTSRSGGGGGGGKRDEKIAKAVRGIQRTKSGESDYKRTNIPKLPMNPNDTTNKRGKTNTAGNNALLPPFDQEESMEELPSYNPTGNTYTDSFNLDTAKEKEEEKAVLLKEFIEKGPDPNNDSFKLVVEGGDDNDDDGEETDDDNSHAGWGIHCLKSQLQVVKSLSKNEVRTLTLTKDRNNLVSANPVLDPRRKSTRASTLGLHMADMDSSKQRRIKTNANIKRTTSLDDSFSSLQLPPQKEINSLDNLQARMNEVQSALEKTMGVAESLKKHSTAAAMMEDASAQSMQVTSSTTTTTSKGGRGAPPQRGVLRRNSSLSDLDKLKKGGGGAAGSSSKSSSSKSGGTKRGGRKKTTVPVEAKRKKKIEESKSDDDVDETTSKATTTTKTSSSRGRSGSVSPGRRRMMRRGSSMSNIGDADDTEASDFMKELKKESADLIKEIKRKKKMSNDSSNNNNKSTMDESSIKKDRSRSRSGSVSVTSRRAGRRRSVATTTTSEMKEDGSGLSVSGDGRKGRRSGGKSPKPPDSRRRTSMMSDMSTSGSTSGGSSAAHHLSDKLSKLKGVAKTGRGRTSVVSAPVMSDRSAPAVVGGANRRDRSKTRTNANNPRFNRSRSSSIESPVTVGPRIRRTYSTDSGDSLRKGETRSRSKKRAPKVTADMTDLPDLTQSPKSETDAASVATTPNISTTATTTSKTQEAEASKPSKSGTRRAKSPKKVPSATDEADKADKAAGLNVAEKLAALPDIKPKTRKDAKSVRSMPARSRSRSSSAEGKPKGARDRSRSPKRRPKDMHKSMTGVSLAQKVVDDLNEKAADDSSSVSAPFNRSKTVNVMETMNDEISKKTERDAAAGYNRTKTDTGLRVAADSNGRSKSSGKRGLHKSLSGLDEKSLEGVSDLKSLSGLAELKTTVKKGGDSDARSVFTAPVSNDSSAKTKAGKKASYRMSQGYLDTAKLGDLQDEKSGEMSVDSTNSMALEEKMPKSGRRAKSPKKTSFHLSHGPVDEAKLGPGLQDLRKEFANDDQSAEFSVASTSSKAKSKAPKTKRSKSPKSSFHLSHGVLDGAKLGGLEDLRKEFVNDEQSAELSVVSTNTKSKDGKPPKHKGRAKSPKKEPAKKKTNNTNGIDAEMLSNLSDTISQVRTLVGAPAEKDMDASGKSTGSTSRKGRSKRTSVVTPIPESSEPDTEKLHSEMAEKMKQFKMRNEKVDNNVRSTGTTRRDRRRSSSLTGAFTEMAKSDDTEIKGILGKALQGKKSTVKPKRNKSGEKKTRKIRRMSRSLNDMQQMAEDTDKTDERRLLRKHMQAMLDDNSG